MNKLTLRKHYLTKRKALAVEEILEKSQQICDFFFQEIDLKSVQYLHIFLPIRKQNEIDTFLIIKRLQTEYSSIKIVVSQSIFDTFEMQHFVLEESQLSENKWGILEPSGKGEEVKPETIDVIIIPLLIFDKQGNRVGYGKGFYDRFLQKCSPNALKVGICLEEPIEQIEDLNEFDVKTDVCVTPFVVWRF
ncbi:MAG: 5-formyltetrahydrofolate cyclo-ligase [Arcicella sp.]|nr:5-formyltetrahydrofolate cyclo-ligase [Arcicella sp.]